MARPVAIGRDRLGQLGGSHRYGVGVAGLSAVSAEFNIGLADCMIEWIQDMTCEGTGNVEVIRKYSAGTGYVIWYNSTNQRFEISLGNGVGATTYNIGTTAQLEGRRVHGHIFMDRSALAYAFVDGVLQGSVDISARAADNQDTAAACQMLYDGGGFWASPAKGLMYRVFNFGVDAGPSAADMATIAAQRFINPGSESAVLAARANYATERRVDVSFNDINDNATTIANAGTGAATFTIGGALHWYNVRSVAERCALNRPAETWYTLDLTHEATNAAAALGAVSGDNVCEIIYKDLSRTFGASDQLVQITGPGANTFALSHIASSIYVYNEGDGSAMFAYLKTAGWQTVSLDGLHVMHIYYSQAQNRQKAIVDGNCLFWSAAPTDQDFTGNLALKFGDSSMWDGILAVRLWNGAACTADLDTELRKRTTNPWTAATTLAGATLIGNWECKLDAVQGASSAVLVNRINPTVGDLTLSPASTCGACFVEAVRGM